MMMMMMMILILLNSYYTFRRRARLNVMAHAQKPDFVFRRNGTSPFKLAGALVQSTTGSRGVRIRGSNAGYTMLRGSVKGTGYPMHSPVSLSLPLPCVTVCHHISSGLYCSLLLVVTSAQSSLNLCTGRPPTGVTIPDDV